MNPIELKARHEMLRYSEGSPEWLYWRGVCLGCESCKPGNQVTASWAEAVLTSAKAVNS